MKERLLLFHTILQENITTLNIKVFDPTINTIKYPRPVPLLPTRSYEGGLGIQYFTINCKHISDDGVSSSGILEQVNLCRKVLNTFDLNHLNIIYTFYLIILNWILKICIRSLNRRKCGIYEYLRFRIHDVLPENNMEVDVVEMRFKAVNDTNTPDINTIYFGDEFFTYIKYKGCKCQKHSFKVIKLHSFTLIVNLLL